MGARPRATSTAITGLGYLLRNSMLFVFVGMVFQGYDRPSFIELLPGAAALSIVFGPNGCLLCMHLVTPIYFGRIANRRFKSGRNSCSKN